jgi:hypothetical protein
MMSRYMGEHVANMRQASGNSGMRSSVLFSFSTKATGEATEIMFEDSCGVDAVVMGVWKERTKEARWGGRLQLDVGTTRVEVFLLELVNDVG